MLKTVTALTLAAVALTAAPANASHTDSAPRGWRPCPTEDSVACTWDARHMGNGEGTSFRVSDRGVRTAISHTRAHDRIHSWLYASDYAPHGTSPVTGGPAFINLERERTIIAFIP